MPLFKGSLTYARFFVDPSSSKALEDGFADRCLEKLAARPFEPLDPEADAVERMGWCRVGEPFETTFTYGDVFWNDHMLLGLRIDRWVVPPSLVKAKTREAEVFYDRVDRLREVESILRALYRDFLRLRLGPAWERLVVPAMRRWVADQGIDAEGYREARTKALAPNRKPARADKR